MKSIERSPAASVGVLSLCLGVLVAVTTPVLASDHSAHRHEHGASTTLQLNAGSKWETDAPLRQSMGSVRQSLVAVLDDVHHKRLPASGYDTLAQTVEREVGNMVANCKLTAAADEQLHVVIAELLDAAEHMAGKHGDANRRGGAVQVLKALDKYATYFDDPGFVPIVH